MTERLKAHLPLFHVIANSKPSLASAVLENLDGSAVKCLCECAHNILNNNIPLSKVQKKRLSRYKNKLRKLDSKRVPLKEKKDVLVQSGGFASALIAPILTIAGSLLAEWLTKK